MTRPIFEPNEQRQIAALGFDKNQLFRRPAPQSQDDEPEPPAWGFVANTTQQTIPDATFTQLDQFDVFDSHDSPVAVTSQLASNLGLSISGGWWLVGLAVRWSPTFDGRCCVVMESGPEGQSELVLADSSLPPQIGSVVNRVVIPWPSGQRTPNLNAYAYQSSGAPQDIENMSLWAVWMGDLVGTPESIPM